MGNLYHANDKTTTRIRNEIQDSEETLAQLARRLSLNPKTVRYWKQANRVTDNHSGPQHSRSTVLPPEEEPIIFEFRRLTRLALDDVFAERRHYSPHPFKFTPVPETARPQSPAVGRGGEATS